MIAADNRRIPGWRVMREYLGGKNTSPRLFISNVCDGLIRSIPALLCDRARPEDASGEPHSATHAPEALRYALMSRVPPPLVTEEFPFTMPQTNRNTVYE